MKNPVTPLVESALLIDTEKGWVIQKWYIRFLTLFPRKRARDLRREHGNSTGLDASGSKMD